MSSLTYKTMATHLTQAQIKSIFDRTKQLYPELLLNHEGGEYTPDHPGAEGIATIFKIKLDEFDRTQEKIEAGKKKCLAAMGCKSVEDLMRGSHRYQAFDNTPVTARPAALTLGDFMTTTSKKKNRKHK